MNIIHVGHGLKNVPTLYMCLGGPNLCYQYYTFFILVVLIYLNIDLTYRVFLLACFQFLAVKKTTASVCEIVKPVISS